MLERRVRLQAGSGEPGTRQTLQEHLERNVWPLVPPARLGRTLSREEEDRILFTGGDFTQTDIPTAGTGL